MRRVAVGAALVALLLALGAIATAQSGQPIHAGPVYTSGDQGSPYPKYPDIQVQVDIPPDAGPELRTPERFLLQAEDKSPVQASQVTTLAATGYGIALVAAIDVSGSMRGGPLNAVRAGLSKFVSEATPSDKLAVVTIADDGRWDVNWDDPRDKVKASLEHIAARGTRTRLWDSLLDAIGRYPDTPLSRHLMVVSDGHDEGSSHTQQEVIKAARERNVVVDAVGITRSDPKYLRSLQDLAVQTGGGFRAAKDTQQLQQFVGDGIQSAKNTPVALFHLADLPGDGKEHRLVVTWKHGGEESRAEATALIPLVSTPSKNGSRWLWIAVAAGAAMLILLAVIIARCRRRKPIAQTLPTAVLPANPQPVSVTPSGRPASPLAPRQIGAKTFDERSRPVEPVKQSPPPVPAAPKPRQKTQHAVRFSVPSKELPAAFLVCEEGIAPGRSFPLDQAEFWIGASENNHLRMPDDRTVSGNHACLMFDRDVLGIYDNNSTNGTLVNGELVASTRRVLRPGDRICIGQSTFVVKLAEPGAAGA